MGWVSRCSLAGYLGMGLTGVVASGCCALRTGGVDDGAAMTADVPSQPAPSDPVITETPGVVPHPEQPLVIEESDLVKLEADRLYVHNARTGLHVFDVSDPRAPLRVASIPQLGGEAGEIYAGSEQVLLLIDRPAVCSGEGDSAVVSLLSAVTGVSVAQVLCLEGEVVSSRLIGDALYLVNTGGGAAAWTSVQSFDVSTPGLVEPVESERFAGAGHELHVTERAIYVAQPSPLGGTRVHYLDISAGDGSLVGRDSIDLLGAPMGRFHMSEHADTFRIVTRLGDGPSQTTRLSVIAVNDPDELREIGSLPSIAPGETLFATRFVEDRAYIVTYRPAVVVVTPDPVAPPPPQTGSDPLWIVSLEDPTEPVVLSELEIPGWSDFIFPRGDQLLAVGRGTGGRGIAASLFDVADPLAPRELQRLEFGGDQATSEANTDFRAVTVVEDQLGPVPLLVVPYTDNVGLAPGCSPVHHTQLLQIHAQNLSLAGRLEMPGRVQRTLPVGDTLYVVNERSVEVTDVSDRLYPSKIEDLLVDSGSWTDSCEFPPPEPQIVVTQPPSNGWTQGGDVMWVDDDRACACSTATGESRCMGASAGWLALLGAALVGLKSWRRRQHRGAPAGR